MWKIPASMNAAPDSHLIEPHPSVSNQRTHLHPSGCEWLWCGFPGWISSRTLGSSGWRGHLWSVQEGGLWAPLIDLTLSPKSFRSKHAAFHGVIRRNKQLQHHESCPLLFSAAALPDLAAKQRWGLFLFLSCCCRFLTFVSPVGPILLHYLVIWASSVSSVRETSLWWVIGFLRRGQ